MKTTKFIIAFCVGIFISTVSMAQQKNSTTYHNAVGVRGGGTTGLTFKTFISKNDAIELMAGVWPGGATATALYERHTTLNLNGISGFRLYYGGGVHASTTASNRIYYWYRTRYYDYYYGPGRALAVGVDGIIGLEYKIKNAPIAASLDLKPFVEVNTLGGAYIGFDPGLGIKYTF